MNKTIVTQNQVFEAIQNDKWAKKGRTQQTTDPQNISPDSVLRRVTPNQGSQKY